MRVEGIQGAYVPPKRRGNADCALGVDGVKVWPDLVKRDFQPTGPNQLWCSDLKQIGTGEGVLHLASVLDCFSRRIVGWPMVRSPTRRWSPARSRWPSPSAGPARESFTTQTAAVRADSSGRRNARSRGVALGTPKRRRSDRAGRPLMRSPGRPPGWRREHRQRFWAAIARGATSEAAGVEAGVSPAVGVRWLGRGRMPSVTQAPLSGRYLSFVEREEIALLWASGCGVREIARQLGARRRRSLASCVVTLRLAAAGLSIGRARRSGMRTGARAVRSRPSWLSMLNCGGMCRIVCLGPWSGLRVARWTVPRSRGSAAVTVGARTGAGRSLEPGADLQPAQCRFPR